MTKAADLADIARGLAPFSGAIHERSGDVFCYFAGFNLSEFARRVTAQADAPAIQPQRMPDRETIARTAYAADPDLQVWRSTGEPNFTWEEIKNFPNAEDHCLPFYNIADAIIAITRPKCGGSDV